jgi:hypothetical protein
VLDTGSGEEVVDDTGDDFVVHKAECGFHAGVSSNTTTFDFIGYIQSSLGIDNATLDIGKDDLSAYRYVMLISGTTQIQTLQYSSRLMLLMHAMSFQSFHLVLFYHYS